MSAEQGDTEFVSILDEASKKVAKDELNERNDKDRLLAVQTFRQWILEQSWLRTPTDFEFLLRFLRAKKFSQLEARNKIEHFWTIRGTMPEWFRDRDPVDSMTRKLLKMGVTCIPLKRDKNNRRVVINCLAKLDQGLIAEAGMTAFYRAMITVYDWLTRDENVQVNGCVFISDYTGLTIHKFRKIFNADRQKRVMSYFEHGLPARLKSINIYNEPAFFDFIYSVASAFMSTKIKSRLHIHGKSLVSIYKELGYECLPDEYLPDDYEGPRIGPVDKVIDEMLGDMSKPDFCTYVKDLSSDKYGVDKDRIPTKERKQETASYRKLNVD